MNTLPKTVATLLLVIVLTVANFQTVLARPDDLPRDEGSQEWIEVLDSSDEAITVRISLPEYSLEQVNLNGGDAYHLSIPGVSSLDVAGAPELPLVGIRLGIPADAAPGYQILDTCTETRQLDLPLASVPFVTNEGDEAEAQLVETYQPDETVFSKNALYPASPVEYGGDGWIRSQRVAAVRFYPVQYNPLSGELAVHRCLTVRIAYNSSGEIVAQAAPEMTVSPFEDLFRSSLLNYERAIQWRAQETPAETTAMEDIRSQAASEAVRMMVTSDGIYRITYEALQSAGLTMGGLRFETLGLFNLGRTVSYTIEDTDLDGLFEAGESILFFGQKIDSEYLASLYPEEDDFWLLNPNGFQPQFNAKVVELYTKENVYFLYTENFALSMETVDGTPQVGTTSPDHYRETLHAEQNNYWYSKSLRNMATEDAWIWSYFTVTTSNVSTPVGFDTTGISSIHAGGSDAVVRGEIIPGANNPAYNPDHHVKLSLNNSAYVVQDYTFDGLLVSHFEGTVPSNALIAGTNTLIFQKYLDAYSGQSADAFALNWFEIEYDRDFVARSDALEFSPVDESGPQKFVIQSVTSASAVALDITDPLAPKLIQNVAVNTTADTATFQSPVAAGSRFIVAGSSAITVPSAMEKISEPDLLSTTNGADYIVIAPKAFASAAQRLANLHTVEGMRTQVIAVEDLYNQFNYGVKMPVAIHNFLRYAYQYWQKPAPTYVALVGDGDWNPNQYATSGAYLQFAVSTEYMLPNLAWIDQYGWGVVESSNLLATVSGNDVLPDFIVGRIPAGSSAELNAYIDKLEQNPGIRTRITTPVIAVAGIPDLPELDFEADITNFITQYGQTFPTTKLFVEDYGCIAGAACPAAKTALTSSINSSQNPFLIFTGHGGINGWGQDVRFFSVTDISSLSNAGKLPVVISLTCNDGYWFYPTLSPDSTNYHSLIEDLLMNTSTGAIGAFSPVSYITDHESVLTGYFESLPRNRAVTLGGAAMGAREYIAANSSNTTLINLFTVFGDPALVINSSGTYFPIVK